MDSKTVKKELKALFPSTPISVNSINGTRNGKKVTHYIQAWFQTNKNIRTIALRVIYGPDFDTGDNAIAGNMRENHLSMHPTEWIMVINNYKNSL